MSKAIICTSVVVLIFFGGMPAEAVHRSMRLIAEQVMPRVADRTVATVA